MAEPGTWEVVRFCYTGGGRSSLANGVATLSAWCLTLAILVFNAFFGLLLEDGNLLLRGVGTLILAVPLLWLYARARRSVLGRRIEESSRRSRGSNS
jgi:membrane protein implicated in regulation of membrane protease activity